MNWVKNLRIKIISMVFGFGSLCFGENNLSELIDKCDFVNFKKAYESVELSDEQKLELLNKIEKIEKRNLNELKPYWHGKIPPLKDANNVKFARYLLNAVSVGFICCNLLSWLSLDRIIKARYAYLNKTAAQIGSVERNIVYSNTKEWMLRRWNIKLAERAFVTASIMLMSSAWFYGVKSYNQKRIDYKQWKKALKIKKLIQKSIVAMPLENYQVHAISK